MVTDMFLTTESLFLLLILLILTLLWLDTRRPSDIPPGPPILVPIFGNLFELNQQTLPDKLRDFRLKYGDVFSLKMGRRWWIIFNGYNTLRDAFIKNGDLFSSRPDLFQFRAANFRGIAASSGNVWKEHRTFTLTKLREFGFGKRSIEENILGEIEVLTDNMKNHKGRPFDIYNILHACVSNVTCAIAFGKRFSHTDPVYLNLIDMISENLRVSSAAAAMTWFPFLKYFPSSLSGSKKVLDNMQKIEDFMGTIIDEHKKTFNDNDHRDYIDTFLEEMKLKENDSESTFTDQQLRRILFELFLAGTETTTTTLRWAILYLINYPDVQEKMREEIEKVVGKNQFPRMHHKQDMPYTEAVITEVQRCGDIAPFSVLHGTCKETTFRGYRIPKDAVLTPNLDSVMFDAAEFTEPNKFNPSRFIGKDGKFCGHEKVIPFSIGRRVCLGESLARMELFLFLTVMVQRFKFLPEKGKAPLSEEAIIGITRSPHPYLFCPVSVNEE